MTKYGEIPDEINTLVHCTLGHLKAHALHAELDRKNAVADGILGLINAWERALERNKAFLAEQEQKSCNQTTSPT
jgi:hypothetical protein